MPPDITTGPSAMTGPASSGRGAGIAPAGPLGGDALAALFAALLVNSDGAPPAAGAADASRKVGTKPNLLAKTTSSPVGLTEDKTTEGKTTEQVAGQTVFTMLPVLPSPLLPIQMKPINPPTAGLTVGQKTMDTSPALPSPKLGTTGVMLDGGLPLQDARTLASAVSAPSSTLLLLPPPPSVGQSIRTGRPVPGVDGLMPVIADSVPAGAALLILPAGPASTSESAASFALPAQPLTPAADLLEAEAPEPALLGQSPLAADRRMADRTAVFDNGLGEVEVTSSLARRISPASVTPAHSQPPEVRATALIPASVQPAPASTAVTISGIIPAQIAAVDGTAVRDREAAETFGARTDVAVTDAVPPAGEKAGAVVSKPASIAFHITPRLSGAGGEALKNGLKSAAAPADNNTRTPMVPAKMLREELPLEVIGKRSERRPEDFDTDVTSPLSQTAPALARTAKAEVTPLTPMDRSEMIRQVAEGVGAMPLPTEPGKAEQMVLQLHPKDWGQLKISVTVSPSMHPNAVQAVTAHIVAETPEVKTALENHSSDLRHALRAAGLNLDQMTVTVQGAAASAQSGTATGGSHHEANSGQTSSGMNSGFGQTPPDQGTGTLGASGNGMPSFAAFAGSHGGRQGSQQPPTYAAAYGAAEPDREDVFEAVTPRRTVVGQVDTRA